MDLASILTALPLCMDAPQEITVRQVVPGTELLHEQWLSPRQQRSKQGAGLHLTAQVMMTQMKLTQVKARVRS